MANEYVLIGVTERYECGMKAPLFADTDEEAIELSLKAGILDMYKTVRLYRKVDGGEDIVQNFYYGKKAPRYFEVK